jgi:hypothetical protein
MAYVPADEVLSPKANWTLVDVVLDRGSGKPAYAIGMWDGRRRVGFRWNGDSKSPLGNPQSRGIATWIMLDTRLNDAVVEMVRKANPEKLSIMQAFMGKPIGDDDD